MAGTVHPPAAPSMPLPAPPSPDQLAESVAAVTWPNCIRRPPGGRNSEAMLKLAPARRGARRSSSPAIVPAGTGDVAAEAAASAMPVEASMVTKTRRTATRTRDLCDLIRYRLKAEPGEAARDKRGPGGQGTRRVVET